MDAANKIDYLEIPAKALAATKTFFMELFGWSFEDCGPEYSSFHDGRITGGFYRSDKRMTVESVSSLIVFYHPNLEAIQGKVRELGGGIKRETFSFPGGRRFHFTDPSGNEYAIWSE